MQLGDSPQEAGFRAEVRGWLDGHARLRAEEAQSLSPLGGFHDDEAAIAEARAFQAQRAEAGLAAVHWPVEHGGRGASALEAMVLAEELARYDVPGDLFAIGIAMIGPTIIAHGTDEQRARYLGPMLRGEEIWCQLWSEPDAGSDLAGLGTRAVRDGDEFVLEGQKVWTSGAHYSQWGLGIFRTDPAAPKHEGISCLIVDMATPGITVRPLRQITGAAHFNEVFFTGVRVPVANLVGDEDDGWRVARTTLMNERYAAGAMDTSDAAFQALVGLARWVEAQGRPTVSDPLVRQDLARIHTLGRLTDLTSARVRASLARGTVPGVEGSILKLALADLITRRAHVGLALLGPAGTLAGDDAPEGGRWPDAALGSFAMHIGGGTDEIQRNIIGELVLGLPREPATDREVAWKDRVRSHG
jgi:alkylation response protein AidB-like acyl-CoA dehydrogenase